MEDFAFYADLKDLDISDQQLIKRAQEATRFSYAPYSNFFVGAALLLQDGTIVIGANQENVSYPLCMCAERVVLYNMAIQHPAKQILKMTVVARKNEEFVPATCCGACRQVMLEFELRQKRNFEVIMLGADQKWIKCSAVSVLIPFQFEF